MTTIAELHTYSGHSAQFWPLFLAFATRQAQADSGMLLVKKGSSWKQLAQWPVAPLFETGKPLPEPLLNLAEASLQRKQAALDGSTSEPLFFGIKLCDEPDAQPTVLIFQTKKIRFEQLEGIFSTLRLLVDTPAVYQRQRNSHQEEQKRLDVAETLELLLQLNQQDTFLAAAMTLVNESVSRYRCNRVSLGWLVDGYIALKSISHVEQFESKMALATQLEYAMEEAFDQDEEIIFPAVDSEGPVNRDHSRYAKAHEIGQILSLPLRVKNQTAGVLTCERESTPFSEFEIRSLRILCDQISTRLAVLEKSDRNLGTKVKDALSRSCVSLIGVENTLIKLSGLVVCGLLLVSLVVKLPYRIEAPFILRSKDVRQVNAPFSGYIDQVHVDIGQEVEQGVPLATLDSSDLLLEEAAALANLVRYLREEEKARAKNTLIEMKIAQAQAKQAQAQLELIQHRLNRAQLRAPISGILVEGDFTERRGTPVEKGELLFKVARHEKLFAEVRIAERDIQEIVTEQTGELAFVSSPHQKFPFLIDQIDPLAASDESGNSFGIRTKAFDSTEDWWRPGMSGIAKISIGKRRMIWIFTHRTVNFLRLLIWW